MPISIRLSVRLALFHVGFLQVHALPLITDPHVQAGTNILSPVPGALVVEGVFQPNTQNGPPVWSLAQWNSHGSLWGTSRTVLPSGASKWQNSYKDFIVGVPNTIDGDFVLSVDSVAEWGGAFRTDPSTPWPHLLLQHEVTGPASVLGLAVPNFAELTELNLHLEVNLRSADNRRGPGYSTGLHAAQFSFVLLVQNVGIPGTPGDGDYVYMQISIYDDRVALPGPHIAGDTAGSGKLIYDVGLAAFASTGVVVGEWKSISGDLLPHIKAALAEAWKRGFLRATQNLAMYKVGAVIVGWEVPGLSKVSMQVRNLSLDAITATSTMRAPSINLQPLAQKITPGAPLNLTVAATGTPSPTLQWQKDDVNIVGATGSTFTILSSKLEDSGHYAVVATNSAGAITSSIVPVLVTPQLIRIEKCQQFVQTSSAGPVPANIRSPFYFSVYGEGATTLSLKKPSGDILPLPPLGTGFGVERWFSNKTAFDTVFPNGTYQVTSPTLPPVTLGLTPDTYPITPQVTNGTWTSGGTLAVNPLQSNTLTFAPFTTYSVAGVAGTMSIQLRGLNDAVGLGPLIASTQTFDGSPTSQTPIASLTIPENTLVSGRVYVVDVAYSTLTKAESNPVGYAVTAAFTKRLEIFVSATDAGISPAPPHITAQPANVQSRLGANATFSIGVSVGGSNQFTNVRPQWFFEGREIVDTPAKYSHSADRTSLTISNLTGTDTGSYSVRVVNAGGVVNSSNAGLIVDAIAGSLIHKSTVPGQTYTLNSSPYILGATTLQWKKNGTAIFGANTTPIVLNNVQPIDAGIYTLEVTTAGFNATSKGGIMGISTNAKLVGLGTETPNITHLATGNVYDQILLQGSAATITADYQLNQITRISFIDLSDDIVQVEYSGPGSVSVVLENASGPAFPVNYTQQIGYMKGHAGITVTGATQNSNLSIFSVGTLVNGNPTLYKPGVVFDGFADVAVVAITSNDGKFGGIRAGNASFSAAKGLTGVYAPGVQFTGPLFIYDVNAADAANGVIVIGGGPDTRITGGDLLQSNGNALEVAGITQLKLVAGTSSHNVPLPAQTNKARVEMNGADVSAQVIVNPP